MARPSPVTDAVRAVFTAGRRHAWSLDELHGSIRERLGGADYSTVFRAVGTLEREGLIDRVDLGDGKAHYELHDEHHEHVRCDVCGRVAEVPGCVLEDASAAVPVDPDRSPLARRSRGRRSRGGTGPSP